MYDLTKGMGRMMSQMLLGEWMMLFMYSDV
jgi:hypothetical protein